MTPAQLVFNAQGAAGNQVFRLGANAKGVKFLFNLTASAGTTPTITFTFGSVCPDGSTIPYPAVLLTSAAISAVAVTEYTLYPGIAVTANVTASVCVTNDVNVAWTLGGTTPTITGVLYCVPLS